MPENTSYRLLEDELKALWNNYDTFDVISTTNKRQEEKKSTMDQKLLQQSIHN